MSCSGTDDGAFLSAEGLRYEQRVPLPIGNQDRYWPGFTVGNGTIVTADKLHASCSVYERGTRDCGISIVDNSNGAWARTAFFEEPGLRSIAVLATNGETVIVGRGFVDNSKAVFYERRGSAWIPTYELPSNPTDAIAIHRDTAVVAEVDRSGESVLGKLTFLDRRLGQWAKAQVLLSSDVVSHFGCFNSLDMDEDTVIVGDYVRQRAHVFERTDEQWQETAVLTSPNPDEEAHAEFGFSVAVSGNRVAVGASGEEPNGVYVFEKGPDGSWEVAARVQASNASQYHRPDKPVVRAFGSGIALHGDLLIVGARIEGSFAVGINNPIPVTHTDSRMGAAYLFERINGEWQERYYIKVPDSYELGQSVALDAERLWVADLRSVHVWVHAQP